MIKSSAFRVVSSTVAFVSGPGFRNLPVGEKKFETAPKEECRPIWETKKPGIWEQFGSHLYVELKAAFFWAAPFAPTVPAPSLQKKIYKPENLSSTEIVLASEPMASRRIPGSAPTPRARSTKKGAPTRPQTRGMIMAARNLVQAMREKARSLKPIVTSLVGSWRTAMDLQVQARLKGCKVLLGAAQKAWSDYWALWNLQNPSPPIVRELSRFLVAA